MQRARRHSLASSRSALLTTGAIALLLACGDALKQDELDCEEAVSYLSGCCPGFDASRIRCIDQPGCGQSLEPAISLDQSACIRGESCAKLVATGVCVRAQAAWPVVYNSPNWSTGTTESTGNSTPDQVCP